MYTDHFGIEEYPYIATFYRSSIDESKPLKEQKEEKVILFTSKCDISDSETGLNSDKMTLFFPLDVSEGKISFSLGESVEVESYGLIQKGRVLGVFPSQLGGVKVICTRI